MLYFFRVAGGMVVHTFSLDEIIFLKHDGQIPCFIKSLIKHHYIKHHLDKISN